MALVTAIFKVVMKSVILLFSLFGMFIAYLFMGFIKGWIKENDKSPREWTYSGPCKWIGNIVK